MNDLLSAASLFLAVIGLLYSTWYDEITRALLLEAPEHKEDRRPNIKQVGFVPKVMDRDTQDINSGR